MTLKQLPLKIGTKVELKRTDRDRFLTWVTIDKFNAYDTEKVESYANFEIVSIEVHDNTLVIHGH